MATKAPGAVVAARTRSAPTTSRAPSSSASGPPSRPGLARPVAGHVEEPTFLTGAERPHGPATYPTTSLAPSYGSGYRSSVAASLLARQSTTAVLNVLGSMSAWKKAAYDMVR